MTTPAAFPPATAERLRASACRGGFEAHLTVEATTPERRVAFEAVCAGLGVRCVLVELASGAHRSQPMTASDHEGDLASVVSAVEALHARLWAEGFAVVRVKIEAATTNDGVPVTDEQAAAMGDGYYECHAKVRLADATERGVASLRALCASCDAHLSRNDRGRDERGVPERFVTQRAYGAGRARAFVAFDALLGELARAGHEVVGAKREYTVYDGRPELDRGWSGR